MLITRETKLKIVKKHLKDYVVEFSTWGSKAYTTLVRLASYSSMLYFD